MRSVSAAAVGLLLAATLAACGGSHGAATQTSEPPLGFRSPPSFLPSSTPPVDQVLTASPAHPQLATQGVAVDVDVAPAHVLALVTGPAVPPFVSPPPPNVTATFDVSLSQVSGTVPVRLDDFTITDQLGRTFHPTLVQHAAPPPSTLRTGQTADFKLTAVMPTGEGRLYWSPTGSNPYVGWDFIVEND